MSSISRFRIMSFIWSHYLPWCVRFVPPLLFGPNAIHRTLWFFADSWRCFLWNACSQSLSQYPWRCVCLKWYLQSMPLYSAWVCLQWGRWIRDVFELWYTLVWGWDEECHDYYDYDFDYIAQAANVIEQNDVAWWWWNNTIRYDTPRGRFYRHISGLAIQDKLQYGNVVHKHQSLIEQRKSLVSSLYSYTLLYSALGSTYA